MKKIMKMLLLAAIFTLALSVSAFAAEEEDAGIYGVTVEEAYKTLVTVTPLDADKNAVPEDEASDVDGFYPNAVQLKVDVKNAAEGKYYLVLALNEEGVPEKDNVYYIDQDDGSNTLSFNVYPKDLEEDTTYYIYLSSNDGSDAYGEYVKVASFQYYEPAPAFTKGDTNLDSEVNASDVTTLLRHVAKIEYMTDERALQAGDVANPTGIGSEDVTKLLRFVAKIDSSL